jgi:phage-related protein
MPTTEVLFYQDKKSRAPALDWLRQMRRKDRKVFAKCVSRIEQLAASGHELRRPAADMLREGIYELRAKHGRVQCRILYFFHGRNAAVLAHAIIKEDAAVPPKDIERALERKRAFEADPESRTYEGDLSDG